MPSAKVPNIVESFSLTGQTANIATTTIYTPSDDGIFRISLYVEMFNFTAGDGVGIALGWTTLDGTAKTAQGSPSAAPTGSGSYLVIAGIKSGTNVTYTATTSLSVGASYNFYIVVESLQ